MLLSSFIEAVFSEGRAHALAQDDTSRRPSVLAWLLQRDTLDACSARLRSPVEALRAALTKTSPIEVEEVIEVLRLEVEEISVQEAVNEVAHGAEDLIEVLLLTKAEVISLQEGVTEAAHEAEEIVDLAQLMVNSIHGGVINAAEGPLEEIPVVVSEVRLEEGAASEEAQIEVVEEVLGVGVIQEVEEVPIEAAEASVGAVEVEAGAGIELINETLGDYSKTMDVSFLTSKKGNSSSASPELEMIRYARFVSMAEPEKDDQIYVGKLKQISGGDKLTSRGLFKNTSEFKPQFKLTLMCNDLPKLAGNDGGVARRIEVVDFISKFVAEPKPHALNPHQYLADLQLSDKLKKWNT